MEAWVGGHKSVHENNYGGEGTMRGYKNNCVRLFIQQHFIAVVYIIYLYTNIQVTYTRSLPF